jgi:hypothetical protein
MSAVDQGAIGRVRLLRRGDVDAGLVLEELPGHLERRPPGRSLYRFMRRAPRLLALVLQSLYN